MTDVVSAKVRSQMMAGIRGKNTKPELTIRSILHRLGYRFRLHVRDLPGRPDIVLPKWNAVILVHGCFWHGHDCHLFKMPSTRTQFWTEKIRRNREVDARALSALRADGWRVAQIWECALKGRTRIPIEKIATRCTTWLRGNQSTLNLRGF
ncbi:MAG: very short patch repair endonuclease [Rhodospirillales bacterium 24-66-33]|nr:MAG: very short patch repair endonuclease [Rhodospirillales bacterium 35-66-84]OYZ94994.1 MAG: very short patch repair endonuclease [Rhodospirillales bacterium 24-66-33]OZB26434.1 MAG: very short patch repair endonuclease [Rhodospirillales bacterium 39-66-50]